METTKKPISQDQQEAISKDDLSELKFTLEKKQANHDYATIQSILKMLEFKQITYDLLKETLIGKTITSLTKIEAINDDAKNDAEKVRQKAAGLLGSWRKISQSEKKGGKTEDRKENSKVEGQKNGAKNNASNSNHSSAQLTSQSKKEEPKQTPDEIQPFIPPGMKVNTGTQYRDSLRINFIKYMQIPEEGVEYEEIVLTRAAQLGLQIEDELYKSFPRLAEYQNKARSLMFNLKDPKNPDLRMSLIEGVIEPNQLVRLDSKSLASKALQDERNKTQQANLNARRSDWFIENAAKKGNKGFFTCKKCHSKNTTYFQMQTRGADEPMTNFITCLDCKNQWKC
eukprot:403341216